MDALDRRRPLVVVVNDALMDNHQTELADVRSSERARSVSLRTPAFAFPHDPPGTRRILANPRRSSPSAAICSRRPRASSRRRSRPRGETNP